MTQDVARSEMRDGLKSLTYRGVDGQMHTAEYDPLSPCRGCGLPLVEPSMGGFDLCPWCDTGYARDGHRVGTNIRKATPEEYAEARAAMEPSGG